VDIRPPKRRQTPAMPPILPQVPPVQPPVLSSQLPTIPPLDSSVSSDKSPKPRRKLWWIIGGSVLFLLACCAALWGLYSYQLSPVDAGDTTRTRVTVVSGSTPTQIADMLHQDKLIRSAQAFDIYTRLTKTRNKLQAGSYDLSPSQSVSEIVANLVSGKSDQFKVTFYPGGTLQPVPGTPANKRFDVETQLLGAGYNQADIQAALAKTYDSPLFTDKPAGTSLEGYVYGETYVVDSSTTIEQLLNLAFTTFNTALVDNDIVAGLKAQGLTLYQGITLASIVQAEMGTHQADMPQVAQIFLKRLSIGMPLGSDVTAYYGADKIGASHSVAVDTLYNTRIHAGLPPGPIGAPSLAALKAVAHPAAGDYLFFLSGDDGKTYFATTDAQHEANKVHCPQLCAMQ
jgi:UPF0755 protein